VTEGELAADVACGLAASPKSLPPKWFYDDLGSALFDAICRLPWYRITRAELGLLPRAAPHALAGVRSLVELGPGNGEKLAALLDHAPGTLDGTAVHLVDLSAAALAAACRTLERFGGVSLSSHLATFEEGLAAAAPAAPGPRVVLFLGSNIGNLDAAASSRFLAGVRRRLAPGDRLLLGADLVKPERELLLAYDDPLGVTAAFDRNLLARLNRELGADFPLEAFRHRALWNSAESRVEMHLVAERALEVQIPGAGITARFAEGESLFTESSYKYEPSALAAHVAAQGFTPAGSWEDEDARFALFLFSAA